MSVIGCIVLIFQALLLAHGGFSTLGANTFSMAIIGPFVAYFVYKLCQKLKAPTWLGVFLAAALGNLLTYVTTSFQLALAFPAEVGGFAASLTKFMGIFAVTQIPLAVAEGLLTVVLFNLLTVHNKRELEELAVISTPAKAAKGFDEMRSKNIILIVLVLLIAVFPLLVKSDAEYGGADGEAEVAITEVQPEYEPWMESIWEPPSGEIESLLFALQAAIGAGFIGYYFGFVKGRKENEKAQERVTGQVSTSKS